MMICLDYRFRWMAQGVLSFTVSRAAIWLQQIAMLLRLFVRVIAIRWRLKVLCLTSSQMDSMLA